MNWGKGSFCAISSSPVASCCLHQVEPNSANHETYLLSSF